MTTEATIIDLLEGFAPEVAADLYTLIKTLLESGDQKAAIAKAQQTLITDAADDATDAALAAALK